MPPGRFLFPPEVVDLRADLAGLDQSLEALPNAPAVFLLTLREGDPYLARTAMLRRRLLRLLRERTRASRLLDLRGVVRGISYWPTASRLESSLILYELARQHFPESYLKFLKLRLPPYVKLDLTDPFPRTRVTTHLGAGRDLYYGPFRSRAAAEEFESHFLDLFQIRRCVETLDPHPSHPGCIYGEMNKCLRPCQQAVGVEEYATEASRVADFLSTQGGSLLTSISAARDRLSQELNFEEAARQHKRHEAVEQAVALRDDLAAVLDRMYGVAVTASTAAGSAKLWFPVEGSWQPPVEFLLQPAEVRAVSLDQRLRELIARLDPAKASRTLRQEHMALLARWYYSSWRDGEWLSFDSLNAVPFRKLVRAISRVGRPYA